MSPKRAIEAVAAFYRETPAAICGYRRHAPVMHARIVALYMARLFSRASLVEIGRACGRRHHTTVMHDIAAVEERLKTDVRLLWEVVELKRTMLELERTDFNAWLLELAEKASADELDSVRRVEERQRKRGEGGEIVAERRSA